MRAWALGMLALCGWALATCAPPASKPTPALWRIVDTDSTIYLFGTMHVLAPDLAWRSDTVRAAFNASEELVVETDTASAEGFNDLVNLTARLGHQDQGRVLAEELDAATRARLARVAANLELDPARLETLRPWLVSLRISLTYAERHGESAEAGVEAALFADAAAQTKSVSYLETAEQQIRTLADLSSSDQVLLLAATLRQIEEEDSLDAITAAWARGDIEAFTALVEPQIREAGPAAYAALMTTRNAAWTEVILRRLAGSGDIFVAVGAGHLSGPDSVIEMLEARGVRVKQIAP